jgi:hypothetical protein
MQTLTTLMISAAGLTFSCSLALLMEELMFGAIFRVLSGTIERSDPNRK